MKTCITCKEEKSVEEFFRSSRGDGRENACKNCRSIQCKKNRESKLPLDINSLFMKWGIYQ